MAWAHAGVQLLHYTGNGMMVNAPYTGAFVRIDSIYAPGWKAGDLLFPVGPRNH